jgi:hypothetical protein
VPLFRTQYAARPLHNEEIGTFRVKLIRRAYDDDAIGNEYDVITYDTYDGFFIWHHIVVTGTVGEALAAWEKARLAAVRESARRAIGMPPVISANFHIIREPAA